jgi:branched-chain amino acid transport system substrate-binding protein
MGKSFFAKSRVVGPVFGACLTVTFAFALLACQKKEVSPTAATEILIGEYGSMSGATATFGQSSHMGSMLAIDSINARGGVLGKKLRIISEDDQGKPEEAITVITKLINKDRVSAILGEFASSNSLAGGPVCQKAGIPMLTPGSTNPKVTEIGNFIFRACFIDPFQGTVMAKFTANSLKLNQVAILRDIKSDYSVGLADYFIKSFTAMGGQIVADESYSAGDKDFSAQLTSLKSKNPEAIFVPGYYTEVGLLVRQARKLGITVPLLGGDGWDSEKLWEIGGEALNGCFFSNHYSVDDPSPVIQGFVAKFKARYDGKVPDAIAALGFDAAMILADAIQRAGNTNPDSIRMALAATQSFPGVTGVISLDIDRNAIKSAVVLEIRDGKNVFKGSIDP